VSLSAAVECLLFVAGEPLALRDIARALGTDEAAAEAAVRALQTELGARGSGLQVVRIAGGWQLATRPDHAEAVGRLLARSASRLSRAALETAAIIAYRQPITQPEIEAVRGVAASSVLKTLLDRRLIAEVGRKQAPGRPILYGTTGEFLHYFGLNDLSELPPLEDGESAVVETLQADSRQRESPPEPASPASAPPGSDVRSAPGDWDGTAAPGPAGPTEQGGPPTP